jgi:hypothetical protein
MLVAKRLTVRSEKKMTFKLYLNQDFILAHRCFVSKYFKYLTDNGRMEVWKDEFDGVTQIDNVFYIQ